MCQCVEPTLFLRQCSESVGQVIHYYLCYSAACRVRITSSKEEAYIFSDGLIGNYNYMQDKKKLLEEAWTYSKKQYGSSSEKFECWYQHTSLEYAPFSNLESSYFFLHDTTVSRNIVRVYKTEAEAMSLQLSTVGLVVAGVICLIMMVC